MGGGVVVAGGFGVYLVRDFGEGDEEAVEDRG